MKATDYVPMTLVTAAWIFSCVVLWVHYSDTAFGIWAGFGATITGVYHWIVVKDDKEKDAC